MQDKLESILILVEILEGCKSYKKKVDVPIEREEIKPEDWVKETGPRMKKQRKENTGIIITVTDAPMPVVVHVQALSLPELPLKYLLSSQPKVWQTGDKLFYEKDCILAAKGSSYSPKELEGILQHIQLAGDHLAEVNRKVNNKKPNLPTVTFKDGEVQRRSATPC